MAKKVLVLCTGNSCRSQMAEAYLRYFGGDGIEVYSAGIEAHGVNPMTVASMRRDQIDISLQTSDQLDKYLGMQFDYVITVCDHAAELCPVFPGNALRVHCNFPDPAKAHGDQETREAEFDRVRKMIKQFSLDFVTNQLASTPNDEHRRKKH